MKKLILALFVLVFCAYAQNDDYDSGIKLYKNKEYAKAQKVFEHLVAQDTSNTELWYLLGLCFRAQSQFEQALQAQNKASALNPSDVYVKIELVRLNLALGNKKKALKYLQQALSLEPGNATSLALEKKIKSIEKVELEAKNTKKPLSYIGLGYQYSIISRSGQPDWKMQELFAGTWIRDNINLHGHVQNYTRFDNSQQHYGLGLLYVSPQDHALDLTLSKGFSTVFLPRTRLRSNFDFKIFYKKNKPISGLRLTLNGQYDQYENLKIGVIKPGTKILLQRGFDVQAQSILIVDENRDHLLYGIGSRVNWFSPNNTWHLFAGVSFAPETDNAVVIDTSAFFCGGRYKLKSNYDLIASYSHENRKNSFLRDVISMYVRKNF
ncbi:YaiO family outer membrane beta-barrel protein [bacterium]|nr:YaiO family outer membrane beta-barrel protein [bacterium]